MRAYKRIYSLTHLYMQRYDVCYMPLHVNDEGPNKTDKSMTKKNKKNYIHIGKHISKNSTVRFNSYSCSMTLWKIVAGHSTME